MTLKTVVPSVVVGGFTTAYHVKAGETRDFGGIPIKVEPPASGFYCGVIVEDGGLAKNAVFVFTDSTDGFGVGALLKGGAIQDSEIIGAGLDGILCQGGNGSSVTNCIIDNSGRTGISVTQSDDTVIDGCAISNSQDQSGSGLGSAINIEPSPGDSSSRCIVKNNTIDNCIEGIRTAGNGTVDTATILNNTVSNSSSVGISASSGPYIEIQGNTVTNSFFGIRLTDSATHSTVYDNTVTDSTQNGIVISRNFGDTQDACTVNKNTVNNSGVYDFSLAEIRNTVVRDNVATGGTGQTIYVQTAADAGGNTFTDNSWVLV